MTRAAQWLYGWLLLLPAAVLLALFTHYPAVATLWHSIHTTPKGSRAAAWVTRSLPLGTCAATT